MAENVIRRGIEAESLLNRALDSFKEESPEAAEEPDRMESSVDQINDLTYVVLRGLTGVVAVYRVTANGDLKRLERWAKELE